MNQKDYLDLIPNENSKDFARKALIHFNNYLDLKQLHESAYIEILEGFGQDAKLYNELSNIKDHLVNNGLHPRSVKYYFNQIKLYLRSCNIRIYNEDVKTFVRFPKILKEKKFALSKPHIQKLIDNSDNYMRFVIIALVSSGCRVSELLQLRYSDLHYPFVNFRAEITKTGVERTALFSWQVWDIIRILKNQAENNDYVFCSDYQPKESLAELERKFDIVRRKAGLISKYQNSNVHHVTIHRLRAYCKTYASLKCGKDFAEGLIGHEGYQGTYNALPDEDKKEEYAKYQPKAIFSITA